MVLIGFSKFLSINRWASWVVHYSVISHKKGLWGACIFRKTLSGKFLLQHCKYYLHWSQSFVLFILFFWFFPPCWCLLPDSEWKWWLVSCGGLLRAHNRCVCVAWFVQFPTDATLRRATRNLFSAWAEAVECCTNNAAEGAEQLLFLN